MSSALITGATKGIGLALSRTFTPYLDQLMITGRNADQLQELAGHLKRLAPRLDVLPFPTDQAQAAERDQLASRAIHFLGAPDILINNAGLFEQGSLLDSDAATLGPMLQVNLIAPVELTRALLPRMVEKGSGHIFQMCSVASLEAFANCHYYTISKYGLLGHTNALREEVRRFGIRVTAVLPGATWSNSWKGVDLPKDRLMPPDAVAKAILEAWKLPPEAMVEELRIRPQLGDL